MDCNHVVCHHHDLLTKMCALSLALADSTQGIIYWPITRSTCKEAKHAAVLG